MYKHTQIGRLTIGILIAIGIAEFFAFKSLEIPPLGLLGMLAIIVLIALLFGSLTISLTQDRVIISFGIGLIKKKYPLAPIVRAEPVKNKWWYGWGIRFTPHGWLYNVSGMDAVEIEFENGKKVRIGTDEPENLAQAILESK